MAINKKYIGNPLGYFNDIKDTQLKKAQDGNKEVYMGQTEGTITKKRADRLAGKGKGHYTSYYANKPDTPPDAYVTKKGKIKEVVDKKRKGKGPYPI